jgi:hypothetical protein
LSQNRAPGGKAIRPAGGCLRMTFGAKGLSIARGKAI